MANFLMKIRCGDKVYNLSNSGEDVYFSSSSSTGGLTLRGIKFKSNQLKSSATAKEASEFEICQAIKKSLR